MLRRYVGFSRDDWDVLRNRCLPLLANKAEVWTSVMSPILHAQHAGLVGWRYSINIINSPNHVREDLHCWVGLGLLKQTVTSLSGMRSSNCLRCAVSQLAYSSTALHNGDRTYPSSRYARSNYLILIHRRTAKIWEWTILLQITSDVDITDWLRYQLITIWIVDFLHYKPLLDHNGLKLTTPSQDEVRLIHATDTISNVTPSSKSVVFTLIDDKPP